MRNLLAIALCVLSVPALRADDWPQWLGPKRDAIWRETGILEKFPADGPKVLWRFKVANGYSGPAVANGLVYVTDFLSKDDLGQENFEFGKQTGKERVFCLDAKTGEKKWSHEYDVTYQISYPNGPRCTPTVDGDKVYTLGAMGNLKCFDARSGKIHWERELRKDYGIKAPLWGFSGHPLVDGERLICLVGGKGSVAVAFDKNIGKEIWKALSAKEPGYSPPTIIEVGKSRQLLIWHPESLNGLEPETGKVFWTYKQDTVNGTSIMAPRCANGEIFFAAWRSKGGLVKLNADGSNVTSVWKNSRDTSISPINCTPFIDAGFIYGADTDGEFRCVDLKTGERMWESLKPVAGEAQQSGTAFVVKNGDRFFIAAETGDLIIAKLSPKGYDEISRWHMLERTTKKVRGRDVVWSHPAFAMQCVFARNDAELVCVSLAK